MCFTGAVDGAGSLLQHLRDGVPRTRSELAAATGLGRSTVAQRVDALLASALVGTAGEATSTGGRPPTQFAFNPAARVVLAADVGATHVRLAVTDLAASVLISELVDLDIATGPDAVLSWVVEHGRRLVADDRVATRRTWPASASGSPARSSTPPAARPTRRSCPAGTASTCPASCGPSWGRWSSSTTTSTSWRSASTSSGSATSTT